MYNSQSGREKFLPWQNLNSGYPAYRQSLTSCLGPDLVIGPEQINENKIQLKNQMGMPSLRFWMAEIL
jgi:hypothetical protein